MGTKIETRCTQEESTVFLLSLYPIFGAKMVKFASCRQEFGLLSSG